jgi:hypothetical protein
MLIPYDACMDCRRSVLDFKFADIYTRMKLDSDQLGAKT